VKVSMLVVAALAVTLTAQTPPTPPPAPPAIVQPAAMPTASATAIPSPLPTLTPGTNAALNALMNPSSGKRGNVTPRGTPTPPPNRRIGLDGVWEIQIQRGANTTYEHMKLTQTGTTLTGMYLTRSKKQYPLTGSLDGRDIRVVVSLPDGSTILLSGRVDGTTDMIGMFTDSKERVPFTAAYRAKQNWMENINAQPGGLQTGGGYGGGP
jgi:hypothetical protein